MHWQIWSHCQNHWHGLVLSQNRVKISLHFWCPRLKAHQATYIRMCWKSSIMTSGNILTCMLHALMLCFWPRCKQQFLPTCCPSPGNGISQSKGTIHIERVLPMISFVLTSEEDVDRSPVLLRCMLWSKLFKLPYHATPPLANCLSHWNGSGLVEGVTQSDNGPHSWSESNCSRHVHED